MNKFASILVVLCAKRAGSGASHFAFMEGIRVPERRLCDNFALATQRLEI